MQTGREGPGLRRTVASATGWATIGRFGNLGFALLAQLLVARLLVPANFGAYTLTISIAGGAALVLQAGLPQSGLRWISRSIIRSASAERRAITGVVKTMTLLAGLAFVVTGALAWPLSRIFTPLDYAWLPLLLGALAAVTLIENVIAEVFRGARRFLEASLFSGFLASAVLAAVAGTLYVRVDHRIAVQAALVAAIASSVACLFAAAVRLVAYVRTLQRGRPSAWLNLSVLSASLWATTVLNFFITQSDLWVAGAVGDADEVALYSAAFRLCTLVALPLVIVNVAVPNIVVELHEAGSRRRLERTLQTIATVAAGPSFVLLLAMVLFGRQLLELAFGSFYGSGAEVLTILALGRMLSVVMGSSGVTLLMAGGQSSHLRVTAVTTAITVPAQIIGMQAYGVRGLAVATAASFALQNVLLWAAVRRRFGIDTSIRPVQTTRLFRAELAGHTFVGAVRRLLRQGTAGPGDDQSPGER